MLVFMVRGLSQRLQFPYAQFPCTATMSGDMLYDLVWEAVYRLERLSLKVWAITADGASTNRLFFKLHSPGASEITYMYCTRFPTHTHETVVVYTFFLMLLI